MNKTILLTLAITGSLLVSCQPGGDSGDWIDLSGSLDDWNQVGDANWRVEDGVFVADSGLGQLVTKQSFSDFQIQLEFWTDAGANSGVFIRASDPDNITDKNAYEVNIFDTRPDQTYRTGSIVNIAPPSEIINTPNKWNTFDITADGTKLKVILNGVTTVDTEDDQLSSGPFTLQYGEGVVKFRNVRIREL